MFEILQSFKPDDGFVLLATVSVLGETTQAQTFSLMVNQSLCSKGKFVDNRYIQPGARSPVSARTSPSPESPSPPPIGATTTRTARRHSAAQTDLPDPRTRMSPGVPSPSAQRRASSASLQDLAELILSPAAPVPARASSAGSALPFAEPPLSRVQIDAAIKQWLNMELNDADDLSDAQMEINKLLDCDTNELDLNHLKLITLSPELVQAPGLRTLFLDHTKLTSLPPAVGAALELRELYVRRALLNELPAEIAKAPALEVLDLSANLFTHLLAELGEAPKLRKLDVSKNALVCLPAKIAQAPALEVLRLSLNELIELPSELGMARSLRELDASINNLITLPPEIAEAPALEVLIVNGNQLVELPCELWTARSLRELDASENRLTSLPSELGKAAKLEVLWLDNNQIASLSPEIGQLSQLRELDLSNNLLTSLPIELLSLPSSCEIELSGNPLSEHVIEEMRALKADREAQGLPTPQISFSRHDAAEAGFSDEMTDMGLARPLLQAVKAWYPNGEIAPDMRNAFTFSDAEGEHQDNVKGLSRLLDRLPEMADFKNHATRPQLQQRARDVLEYSVQYPDFLRIANLTATRGLGTCGDRVAMAQDDVELEMKIHKMKRQSGADLTSILLELGCGVHRRAVLVEVATAKARTMSLVDQVEVHLAYQIGLGERVLCHTEAMLYRGCSGIYDADIQRAKAELDKADEPNDAALRARSNYMASQPFWRDHVQQKYANDFAKISDPFMAKLEALEEPKAPTYVADKNIRETRQKALMNELDVAQHTWTEERTLGLLSGKQPQAPFSTGAAL